MKKLLQHCLAIHRYPDLMVDLLVVPVVLAALRLHGDFRIGRCASVRGLPIVTLHGGTAIRIGSHARLISRSWNTALGVNHPVVIRTMRSGARIDIGDSFAASGVTLCAANSIRIGHRVTVGANATIVDTDFHSLDPSARAARDEHDECPVTAPIVIEDDVFIGMNALVLKGVTVGARVVVGAGSVVTRSVPAGAIVAGNPARVVAQIPVS